MNLWKKKETNTYKIQPIKESLIGALIAMDTMNVTIQQK